MARIEIDGAPLINIFLILLAYFSNTKVLDEWSDSFFPGGRLSGHKIVYFSPEKIKIMERSSFL